MTTSGGQAHSAAFPKQSAEIISLRNLLPINQPYPESDAKCDVLRLPMLDTHNNGSQPNYIARFGFVAFAVLIAVGQAAAWPILGLTDGTDTWLVAAAFGIAAAVGAKAFALIYGLSFQRGSLTRQAPDDLAFHDSLSLALVMAGATIVGWVSAVLLLPGAILLSRAMRRIGRRRMLDGKDASLLFVVLIGMAGICQMSGVRGWVAAASVLLVAAVVRVLCRTVPAILSAPIWRKWMVTALICAAIAMMDFDRGATATFLPALKPAMLGMLAGVLYGTAVMAGALTFSRVNARLISGTIPFLAVAMAFAVSGTIGQGQIVAAVLIAGTLASSSRYVRPAHKSTSDENNEFDSRFIPQAPLDGSH
ncbi:MAG: hypothetical protein P8Y36_02635 [Alphaproteobacteria bacterium]